MQGLSTWQYVLRSFAFYRRINLSVACGVAAATAVLVGALLVGDSMRGSLRQLLLDRLGKINNILVTDRFFRTELRDSLVSDGGFQDRFSSATPAILLPQCTVKTQSDDQPMWATGIFLIGIDSSFWSLDSTGLPSPGDLANDEIIVNEAVAARLEVQPGDLLSLYMPKSGQVPADSPLGRRDDSTEFTRDLKIKAIVPAKGLGQFSISPNQRTPLNVYVALSLLQDTLDQEGRINSILVTRKSPSQVASLADAEEDQEILSAALKPTLEDYGLSIDHVQQTFSPSDMPSEQLSFEYFQLVSERLILDPTVEVAAQHAFGTDHSQPALTYMAISIASIDDPDGGIPYSTVTAIDSTSKLGPVEDDQGMPVGWQWQADDEIMLTSWAAEDLRVGEGDQVVVTYYGPETTHGEPQEEQATFTVVKVLPLTEPSRPYSRRRKASYDQRPTHINDPDLTPTVPGITDQDSLRRWDPPFPYEPERIRSEDDDYWEQYRTTPKALIPLETGKKLWGSRFGTATSIRVPALEGVDQEQLTQKLMQQLDRDKTKLGFQFLPIRQQGLRSSAGTTPFDVLFLCLSFFIIAAALLLVALLFRLGVERRYQEIGLLCAVGVPRKLTTKLFVYEAVIVAGIGAALGTAIGIGYGWLMLVGLKVLWIDAIVTPFLTLHITTRSLLIGYVAGLAVSVITIIVAVRFTKNVSERTLLSGHVGDSQIVPGATWWFTAYLIPLLLAIAIVLSIVGTGLHAEARAGAFVGGGALVLTALLLFVRNRLRRRARVSSLTGRRVLVRLAGRNAARNPTRSTLTLGLMATATFLIVAMSAFRMSPSESGTGGFDLIAETAAPIYEDLNDAEVRNKLLGDDAEVLDDGEVVAFRLKPGDDASCRNLYKSSRPRVLGLPGSAIQRLEKDGVSRFAWADTAATTPEEKANPWLLLEKPSDQGDAIPVILDNNTAMYALNEYGGIGAELAYEYEPGKVTTFKVVGLLAGSVLQGNLIIAEEPFTQRFPSINGYRYFLIRSSQDGEDETAKSDAVNRALQKWLGELGFAPESADQVLQDLLAVQNTYLSAFQSLGALGLLLGVFGLATVQLRSVLERRSELALMQATGFRKKRLAQMVMLENLWLLVVGLATGFLAALLSVLPHIFLGGANVPLSTLLGMLVIVLCTGSIAGLFGVYATLNAPLVSALRGE